MRRWATFETGLDDPFHPGALARVTREVRHVPLNFQRAKLDEGGERFIKIFVLKERTMSVRHDWGN